jgi:hypothetical protein
VVHNYLENFREFLLQTGDSETLMARRFNGDQALFWYGPEKLVISSAPIENADLLRARWGYELTECLSPQEPGPILSHDIIHSPELRKAIVEYAGDAKQLAVIPYANTIEFFELVEALEKEDGLSIHLPESPFQEDLWIKKYIDTKVGFRTQLSEWLGAEYPLPSGFITTDLGQSADMVGWFARRGKGSVVKADQGGSGVGNLFLPLEVVRGSPNITNLLEENKFLRQGVFIVEEWIASEQQISPSIEFYVPRQGEGEVKLTYLCNQHFEVTGRFAGVIVAKELLEAAWYPPFRELGMRIAGNLQALGYAGYFDLDAILDDEGRAYLVEINSRRTGGTFAHEFLAQRYGEKYVDQITIISQNKLNSRFRDLAELEAGIQDLLYPINDAERGVIPLLTSTLSKGDFGCIIVGKSIKDVKDIQTNLFEKLA